MASSRLADLVPDEARGRAFGFFYASTGLAALPSSLLFGLWWKLLGPRSAFLIGAALAVLSLVGLLLLRSRLRPEPMPTRQRWPTSSQQAHTHSRPQTG